MVAGKPKAHAYYSECLERFVDANLAEVVGALTLNSGFAVERGAARCLASSSRVQDALRGLPGTLFFEHVVPRLGSRIDAVLILGPAIVVIEFKIRNATRTGSG
jgi:hypothetical protein